MRTISHFLIVVFLTVLLLLIFMDDNTRQKRESASTKLCTVYVTARHGEQWALAYAVSLQLRMLGNVELRCKPDSVAVFAKAIEATPDGDNNTFAVALKEAQEWLHDNNLTTEQLLK